jgi:hypothetical protein
MKKPDTIDLELPAHRVAMLRAYHALLSYGGLDEQGNAKGGMTEEDAKKHAASYALKNWDDLMGDYRPVGRKSGG